MRVTLALLVSLSAVVQLVSGCGGGSATASTSSAAGGATSATGTSAGGAGPGGMGGGQGASSQSSSSTGGGGGGGGPSPPPIVEQWAEAIGIDPRNAGAGAIAVDPAGNVVFTVVCGPTMAGDPPCLLDFGGVHQQGDGFDLFVVKLAPDSTYVWSKRYSASARIDSFGVAADASGNVFVTGNFLGTVDFDGTTLDATDGSGFLLKLDSDGNFTWSKQIVESDGAGDVKRVAVDAAGDVILAGTSYKAADFGLGPIEHELYVVSFDPTGTPIWDNGFSAFEIGDLAVSPSGEVAISYTDYTPQTNDDACVVKLDASGQLEWFKSSTSPAEQDGKGVAIADDGTVFASFQTQGPMVFEGQSFSGGAPDHADLVIVAISPAGTLAWGIDAGPLLYAGDDRMPRLVLDRVGGLLVYGVSEHKPMNFGGVTFTPAFTEQLFFADLQASDGTGRWAGGYGTSYASIEDIAVDSSGAALLLGEFQGNLSFGSGGPTLNGTQNENAYVAKITY